MRPDPTRDLTRIKDDAGVMFIVVPSLRDACVAKITYIENGGAEHQVEVPTGLTVMDGAKRHTIPGIEGDCGGACACATCHVYVDEAWMERLPPMEELERAMLDFAFDVRETSRLSCQIKVDDSLSGLVIKTPARQY